MAVDSLGQVQGEIMLDATTEGYGCLLRWAKGLDATVRFGVESTGSYGAGLCRYLENHGEKVFEVEAPRRKSRRNGKSDTEDALLAAKSVLSSEGCSLPRSNGIREELRVVNLAYETCVKERTRLINQLHALQTSAPARLRERIGTLSDQKLQRRLIGMRTTATMTGLETTTLAVMRDLAKRAHQLNEQANTYKTTLKNLATQINQPLLNQPGIGPITATKLLLTSPERFKNEAAFARMNGTAPIPASSGKTQRHRLNRGGDRQTNYAIHMIALNRTQHHPETRAYLNKKQAEGKTRKEAMRSLKRHISRHLYKTLTTQPLTP